MIKANKYFGDKQFYKMILIVAVPIMVQNGFSTFVNLLDNLMVGRVGTDQMSGVAIVNQLLFVFNLSVFGGLSGAGIFSAQYHGSGNKDGIRNVFRAKLIIAACLLIAGICILYFLRSPLINLSLHEGSQTGNPEATMQYAQQYLKIMLIGLLPFALSQCYGSTLRETGETVAPMNAGILAVFVNLVFNYLLIYGKFGFPCLGVRGAAIATVISRFVECFAIIIWTHRHKQEHTFDTGALRHFSIPPALTKKIMRKGIPLLFNEFLWSAGMTVLSQCYSTRGLAVVAGVNICDTLCNVTNVVFIALGSSVAIVVGKLLGANKMEQARDTDTKMITFTVLCAAALALVAACVAPFFPKIYNTTDEVRSLATGFILIKQAVTPFCAFNHASYFTLRSGGKTWITFVFDSVFVCLIPVPIAFLLAKFTDMPVLTLYAVIQALELIKCGIGYGFLRSGSWVQNVVDDLPEERQLITE